MMNLCHRKIAGEIALNFKKIRQGAKGNTLLTEKVEQLGQILERVKKLEPDFAWTAAREDGVEPSEVEFEEINREAFLLMREAFQQCEAELREAKLLLEEERELRTSMQEILNRITETMQDKINDRVSFKMDLIAQRAEECGVDMAFCQDILKGNHREPEPEAVSSSISIDLSDISTLIFTSKKPPAKTSARQASKPKREAMAPKDRKSVV